MTYRGYIVVIAVTDCHSNMLGIHLVTAGGHTPEEAAYSAIHVSGFYKEFLSKWELDYYKARGTTPTYIDVIEQAKDHCMIQVYDVPDFNNQHPTGLL